MCSPPALERFDLRSLTFPLLPLVNRGIRFPQRTDRRKNPPPSSSVLAVLFSFAPDIFSFTCRQVNVRLSVVAVVFLKDFFLQVRASKEGSECWTKLFVFLCSFFLIFSYQSPFLSQCCWRLSLASSPAPAPVIIIEATRLVWTSLLFLDDDCLFPSFFLDLFFCLVAPNVRVRQNKGGRMSSTKVLFSIITWHGP